MQNNWTCLFDHSGSLFHELKFTLGIHLSQNLSDIISTEIVQTHAIFIFLSEWILQFKVSQEILLIVVFKATNKSSAIYLAKLSKASFKTFDGPP